MGDAEALNRPQLASSGRPPVPLENFTPWTDDYSDLLRLLK
jgi:hypothetical protein